MKKKISTIIIIFTIAISISAYYIFYIDKTGQHFILTLHRIREVNSVLEKRLPEEKWKFEGLSIESQKYELGNPDIEKIGNNYIMYFMRINEESFTDIHIALSSDGLKWEIQKEPLFEDAGMPAAVQLSDGKWRLYFYSIEKGGYISAVSEDGINFKVENGIRITAGKGSFSAIKNIVHPDVIRVDNGYRMFFDGVYDARKCEQFKFHMPEVGGECELRYEENERCLALIHSAFSEDGLNWTYEGVVIGFKDEPLTNMVAAGGPTVVKVEDEYRMYFIPSLHKMKTIKQDDGTIIECKMDFHFGSVYLATSKDGKNFEIVKRLNVFEGDPTVVKTDGKLRLYTWAGGRIFNYNLDTD